MPLRDLSFELSTGIPPEQVRPRACDCRFCRIHGAKNWSDPQGEAIIRVADERRLHRYRFGLKTADFFICRVCGAYLGAVLSDADGAWCTVNLRLTDLAADDRPASYQAEDTAARVQRRKQVWTPVAILSTG